MSPTSLLLSAALLGGATVATLASAPPVSAGPDAPIALITPDSFVRDVSDDASYVFVTPLDGALVRIDAADSSSTEVLPAVDSFSGDPRLSGDGEVLFRTNGADIERTVIGGSTTVVGFPPLPIDTNAYGVSAADRAGRFVGFYRSNGIQTSASVLDTDLGVQTHVNAGGSERSTLVNELSADGKLALVTISDAPTGCTTTASCSDVFLFDRSDSSLTDLTRATDGSNSDAASYAGSISPGGRYLTFSSAAGDLIDGLTTPVERFYRTDRSTGITDLVAEEPSNPSGVPSMPLVTNNGDVYFVDGGPTDYSAFGGPDDADDAQLFRWRDGTTVQVSTTPAGDVPNGAIRVPGGVAVAGAANAVAFTSNASDLSPDGTDPFLAYSSWLTEPEPVTGFDRLPSSVRLVDTRIGATAIDDLYEDIGPRVAGSVFELQVTGRGGIPDGVAAAALNLTAAGAQAVGFAAVFACGSGVPGTSNLNYVPGLDVAVATITDLDDDGKVCIFVSAGVELIVDATGTFPDEGQIALLDRPDRYLDSRGGPTFDGQSSGGGKLAPNVQRSVPIAGRGDVPAGTSIALVTVTFIDLDQPGWMRIYPCDGSIPGTSTINAVPGENRANLAFAALAPEGTLCMQSAVGAHVLIDVIGFAPGTSRISAVTPTERHYDSRPGAPTIDGAPAERVRLEPFQTRHVAIGGRGGIPADTNLVAVNLTVTGAASAGWARVWPCDGPEPATSNINYPPSSSVANAVVTGLAADGGLCLKSSTATDAIIDVTAILS